MCVTKYCFIIYVLFFDATNSINLKTNYFNVEQNVKPKKLVSCISDIVHNYYKQHTLIFLKKEIYNSVGEDLIKSELNASSIITSLTNHKNIINGFYILQPSTGTISNYIQVIQHARKTSYFLIIWQLNTTMLDMEKVHDQFWSMRILRVVSVVPLNNGNSLIYVYFPYGSNHCDRSGPPIRVDSCSQEGLSKTFQLFSIFKQLRNFYGCPLTSVGNTQAPENTLYENTEGLFQAVGYTATLINIFKNYYNFTLKIVNVYNDSGGWFFYNESVQSRMLTYTNQTIDFGFGTFSLLDLKSHPDIDYAFPIYPECFCWAVPQLFGESPSIWSNFVNEFSTITWILLVFSYFIAIISIHFISRKLTTENIKFHENSSIMILLFGLIVGQSFTVIPKTKTLKLFLILWAMWMLIIHTAYEASLGSFMTVPTPVHNIASTKEVVKKGLRVAGGVKIHSLFKDFATSNKVMKTVLKKFEILPPTSNGMDIFEEINKNRDLAVLFPKRYILHYGGNSKLLDTSEKAVHILPECVVKTFASPLISHRGTPMSYIINDFLQITFQSGLTKYIRMKGKVKAQRYKVDPKKCTLRHLQGAFTIFGIGHLLASLCFLGEIINSKFVSKY